MSYQDFVNKYNGKPVDFDGQLGIQCMDLYQQYNKDVVGGPHIPSNAKDVWNNYPKDKYDRIANTPNGVPQKGDVMIWNGNVGGGYGHIGMFNEGNVWRFSSFDQNWIIKNAHIQEHNYTNLIGWLHPKTQSGPVGDDVLVNRIQAIVNGSGSPKDKIIQIRQALS